MLRNRTKGTIPSPPSHSPHHPSSLKGSQIDYDKFHKLAGLASANSAKELMRVTKNKLKEEYGTLGTAEGGIKTPSKGAGTPTKAAGSAKKATTTPGSRKRGAGKKTRGEAGDGDDGGDDEERMGESPTKKTKVKKERDAGEEDGEGDVKASE
jgi:hypothetical protein